MDSETDFETTYKQLEETVKLLETGSLGLAEMVEVYEKGIALSERCAKLLDEAELKVRVLSKRADGEVRMEQTDLDFAPDQRADR